MTSAISPINSTPTPTPSPAAGSTKANAGTQVTKNMFLQLLVAQIKNQDPMSPSDGVQFLTQLAQFQQLEQSMNMGQDMSAVRGDLDKLAQGSTQNNLTPTT